MAKQDNDWKHRLGVVFSTNPDFSYATDDEAFCLLCCGQCQPA